MTDRNRLIELIEQADTKCVNTINCGECEHCGKGEECINHNIADHLLANGVIVPPCKVGDVVYYVHETFYDNEYMKAKEDELDFSHILKIVERPNCKTNLMLEIKQFDWSLMDSWLKGNIFLTKEEAESKLKELNDNE